MPVLTAHPPIDARRLRTVDARPRTASPYGQPARPTSAASVDRLLLAKGKRVTMARSSVLGLLLDPSGTTDYLTPESIYLSLNERGGSISLPTVYRVLADLERSGLVDCHHDGKDGSRMFSAARQHRRFGEIVCTCCASRRDISEPTLARQLEALAQAGGYSVSSMSLSLQGVCASCAQADGSDPFMESP